MASYFMLMILIISTGDWKEDGTLVDSKHEKAYLDILSIRSILVIPSQCRIWEISVNAVSYEM